MREKKTALLEKNAAQPVLDLGRWKLGRRPSQLAVRQEREVVGEDLLGMPQVAGVAADLLEQGFHLARLGFLAGLAGVALALDQKPRRPDLALEAELRVDVLG